MPILTRSVVIGTLVVTPWVAPTGQASAGSPRLNADVALTPADSVTCRSLVTAQARHELALTALGIPDAPGVPPPADLASVGKAARDRFAEALALVFQDATAQLLSSPDRTVEPVLALHAEQINRACG